MWMSIYLCEYWLSCFNLHRARRSSLCPFLLDITTSFKWVERFPVSDWDGAASCLAKLDSRYVEFLNVLLVGFLNWLAGVFTSATCWLYVKSRLALGYILVGSQQDERIEGISLMSRGGATHPLFAYQAKKCSWDKISGDKYLCDGPLCVGRYTRKTDMTNGFVLPKNLISL